MRNLLTNLVIAAALSACASTGGTPSARGNLENDLLIRTDHADASQTDELIYQLLAGEMSGHAGDIGEAAAHYRNAAGITADPQIAERATQIALYAEDTTKALDAAERWSKLSPDNIDAHKTLGLLYVRADKADEAFQHFERVIALSESREKGLFMVATALAGEQEPKTALIVMKKLADQNPDDAVSQLAYASLALQAGHEPEVIAATNRILAQDAKNTRARILRARAYSELNEFDLALKDMRQAAAESGQKEVQISYAKLLIRADRFDEAKQAFQTLLNDSPDDPDLIYALGLVLLQEKQYPEARDAFNRLLKSGNRQQEAEYYLARVEEERGALPGAIKLYETISDSPYYLDAQIRIATLKTKLSGLESGRAHLTALRAKAEDEATAVQVYLAEGQLLRDAHRYDLGMQHFDLALKQYPSNVDLLYARALMAERIDRIDLLEADLRTILKEDPDNTSALNALGFTLADRNQRVEEARGYVERAYSSKPNDPAVIDSMGWVYFRLGDYEQSERFLRKAYSLMNDGEIAGHLSELLWTRGKHEEASRLIQEALERQPDHEYLKKLSLQFSN